MQRLALSLIVVLCFSFGADAQGIYQRKKKELVELDGHYKLSGWLISPGLTYMLPTNKLPLSSTENTDDIAAKGRLSIYAEVGRYKIFKYGTFFNYMDYSLAFKRLSGKEEFGGNEGIFKQNYLLGNFNLNNVIQISDYSFIQNSIGVNVDYMLFGKIEDSGSGGNAEPHKLLAQLHYKFGVGFKLTKKLFIIPSVETPILSGYKWDGGKSTLNYFSSRYRPLIFSVRLAWLRPFKAGDCPPVFSHPGDKDKDNLHRQQ